MKKADMKAPKEEVLRELVPVSRYRVRILENARTHEKVLDIREYVNSDTFEGLC